MIGGPTDNGSLTVLSVSLAYVFAAYLLDEARYVPVFALVLFGFVVLALNSRGIGIDKWYLYGLSFGLIGCVFGDGACKPRAEQEQVRRVVPVVRAFCTGVAVLPTLVRGLAGAAASQTLPSGPELVPSILTCLVIAAAYGAYSVP